MEFAIIEIIVKISRAGIVKSQKWYVARRVHHQLLFSDSSRVFVLTCIVITDEADISYI